MRRGNITSNIVNKRDACLLFQTVYLILNNIADTLIIGTVIEVKSHFSIHTVRNSFHFHEIIVIILLVESNPNANFPFSWLETTREKYTIVIYYSYFKIVVHNL